MKTLLLAVLTKQFNKTDAELSPLIFDADDKVKDTALQSLLDMDAARIKRYKDDATTQHDNGYKKAQKEELTKYEKKLKDTFGIETDKIGEELLAEIKVNAVGKDGKKSNLTEDEIKKHPVFIAYEKEQKKLREDAISAKDKEFSDYKTGIEKATRMSTVKEKVNSIYSSLNPILPSKDTAKNERQKKLFLKEFDSFDYETQTDGTILIIENGKRKETPQGHPVLFDDFVKEMVTNYYDLPAQKPKGSSGNDDDDKKKAPVSGQINMNPKSDVEFSQSFNALEKLNDNAKLVELDTNYKLYKQTQS